jgi:hypothetical protein
MTHDGRHVRTRRWLESCEFQSGLVGDGNEIRRRASQVFTLAVFAVLDAAVDLLLTRELFAQLGHQARAGGCWGSVLWAINVW